LRPDEDPGKPRTVMQADPPFAMGASPFRAKGVLYLGSFEYFDRHLPGGRRAVLDSLQDDQLARFFAQPFLAGSWYDSFPGIPMQQASARLARQPVADFIRRLARWQAERDVQGVYRVLLKLATAEMIVERVPLLATRYFDFVTIEQKKVGERSYTAVVKGVPATLATLYMSITEPFLSVAMELAGARNIRFQWDSPEPHGTRAGVGLVRLRRQLRWD
jgi:hypothetical protein